MVTFNKHLLKEQRGTLPFTWAEEEEGSLSCLEEAQEPGCVVLPLPHPLAVTV